MGALGGGHHVEFPHPVDHHGGKNHQVPVPEKLTAEDIQEVVLTTELIKHAGGGASQGVRKIHRVAEIDHQGDGVDHHKDIFADEMIPPGLLEPQREEHHQDVQTVGIAHGREVEHQSAAIQAHQSAHAEVGGEIAEVLQ